MLALLISLVWDGYRHLMTRIQSTEFTALGVALFGVGDLVRIGSHGTHPIITREIG